MDKFLFMKCLRCRAAMVYDKFYGSQEQFWEMSPGLEPRV